MNAVREVEDLALQLEAVAMAHSCVTQSENPYSTLLAKSAKWLRRFSRQMCGAGYIGCTGGQYCNSDHK